MASVHRVARNASDSDRALVCLLPDAAECQWAFRTARAQHRIAYCSRNAELMDTLARLAPVGVLVAALEDADGNATVGSVRVAKVRHPELIIVTIWTPSRSSSRLLLEVARDASNLLVRQGTDDLGEAINEAYDMLAQPPETPLLTLVVEALGQKYSHVDALVRCFLADPAMARVSSIALALGIPRRTLAAHLSNASLPSPSVLLMRLRLLRSIYASAIEGRSIRGAAAQGGFHAPSDLRGALRRHYNVTPSEARSREVLTLALKGLGVRERCDVHA